MKLLTGLVRFALKIALLAATVVVTLELLDTFAEKNHFRYTITEDFND